MSSLWLNGSIIAAGIAVALLSGQHREARLVGADALGDVGALEDLVARHPDDATAVAKLAQRYLDRSEPGLALSVIGKSSGEVQHLPEVEHARARALFAEGRTTDALAAERSVVDACENARCHPWLLVQAARRSELFEAMLDLGLEDPVADPDRAHLAYVRSTREVRLAIQ